MKKKLYHQFACSSLMLPEHRTALARHRRNKAAEGLRSYFADADEQQLEQLQRFLERSGEAGLTVEVTFTDGPVRRTLTALLRRRQPDPDRLRFQQGDREIAIPLEGIVNLRVAPAGWEDP
ncbi:MAG TPA: YolD-like family protein [Firmicutes bacterium]|jgi:hypothetical protein|nr:YolD-like family protein [Bacillota bacterium]